MPDPPESALEVFNYSVTFIPEAADKSSGNRSSSSGGGTLSLSFTRAVAGSGNLAYKGLPSYQTTLLSPWADLIWAVGDSEPTEAYYKKDKQGDSKQDSKASTSNEIQHLDGGIESGGAKRLQVDALNYHSNTRGLRVIPWQNPEKYLVDSWKC